MIYTVSLSLQAKKAFPQDKGSISQSSPGRIARLLDDDPQITQMKAVILGPKDTVGLKGQQLCAKIKSAHPGICIIYLYTKPSEEDLVDTPNKVKVKKITPDAVRDAVNTFMKDYELQSGRIRVSSSDFEMPEKDELEDTDFDDDGGLEEPDLGAPTLDETYVDPATFGAAVTPIEEMTMGTTDDNFPDLSEEMQPVVSLEKKQLVGNAPLPNPMDKNVPVPAGTEFPTIDIGESLGNVSSSKEWDMFMADMEKDAVYKKLIDENSEFRGLVNMIDTLEYDIQAVFTDTALPVDKKFEKITDIGLRKSTLIATKNNIMVDKVVDIITRIILSAKRTVDSEVERVNSSIYTIVANRDKITDMSHISEVVAERAKLQYKLMALARKIIDLYKQMELLVNDEIKQLDSKLPSSNEYINEMVKPIGTQIFTPTNTKVLADRLLKALQENRLTASAMENSVTALIDIMFSLFEKDREIMAMQDQRIRLLQANKVEDVVIVDTILKHCLRLYTGADNSGRTATVLTWAGVLARRNNCLVVDLTGKSKFRTYGEEPVSLEEFLSKRIERNMLCVESSYIPGPEELQDIVAELKTRLNYYPFINIILSPSDISGINQLSVDAKTIYYITNCSVESMSAIKEVAAKNDYNNIARRLVVIDPPISPLSILDKLDIDSTVCALNIIPNIGEIRACALRHDRPYEINSIRAIFEEAFR